MKNKRLVWLSDANTAHTRRWVVPLAERGFNVLVWSLAEPKTDWTRGIPNLELQTAGFSTRFSYSREAGWHKLAYLGALSAIKRTVRQFDPSLVHAHYVSSYGLLATLAKLRPRVVSVWGADIYTAPAKSILHRKAIEYVLDSADSVLSTSWAMRERTLQFTRQNVAVVPFGVDMERFRPSASGEAQRPFTVGSVKTLEEKYGMEFLIRGFALFHERNPTMSMRLIISGGGSLRSNLEELAENLGIRSITKFTGRIDYDDVHKYHQALDVAVYPSIMDSESFGVSVVESQACGVPVVVSRVGGLPEVVEDNKTGLIVENRDTEGIASALEVLARNPQLRRDYGEAGRKRAVQNFSLSATVDQLLTEYSRL